MSNPLESLLPRAKGGLVNIVIDTPKGSRNKYKYDQETHCFRLGRILPTGACFPSDFGSIPQTLGEDGDALDVLVVCDSPSFVGCVLTGKLIGVISANQTEKGKTIRNDRLLAVPVTSANEPLYAHIDELPEAWLHEVEHFFISYNAAQGREYAPLALGGPEEAEKALTEAEELYAGRGK